MSINQEANTFLLTYYIEFICFVIVWLIKGSILLVVMEAKVSTPVSWLF